MLLYDLFYRRFGIRKRAQLMAPIVSDYQFLEFPQESILHYVGSAGTDIGPKSDEYMFRKITKPIGVEHITELGAEEGNPRRLPITVLNQIKSYHLKNRRYRLIKSFDTVARDGKTLIVYNYAWLPNLYKYTRSVFSNYNKWKNIQSTLWKKVSEIAKVSGRQHFVICRLPQVLPGMGRLNLALANGLNPRVLKEFSTPEEMFLLELWKWLRESRAESVLNEVEENELSKVNLVVLSGNLWFLVNLGVLNGWRAYPDNEIEALKAKGIEVNNRDRLDSTILGKVFLRTLIAFTDQSLAVEEAAKKLEGGKSGETNSTLVVQNPSSPELDKTTNSVIAATTIVPMIDATVPDDKDISFSDIPMDTVDADLAALDQIHERKQEQNPEEGEVGTIVKSNPLIPPEENLFSDARFQAICDQAADKGTISAAEYRRFKELQQKSKQIVSPDGKTPLHEFVQIKPEVLAIPESPAVPDNPTVFDKSMLKSSLLEFDPRYIKHVLERDVASMALSLNNAGAVVTSYETEEVEDIANAFRMYTLKLQPVGGAPSTIRFKLPKVEEDGSFVSNGVKYKMRKQRGDLPIRKIAPSRVALTSYYGKLFVSRSEKKVNDYGTWLCNRITAAALNDENENVSSIKTNNVFDNRFQCPRTYAILAKRFSEFSAKGYTFFLNHKKREQFFGKEALVEYEKEGAVLIAKNDKVGFITLDKDDALYLHHKDGVKDFGSIEEFLEFDIQKAPIEYTELKVFGMDIPVGFVLAYRMGLHELVKSLGVKYRRVPLGTRVSMDVNEYSLEFEDETLVFSRDDRLASLFLAGFNNYHREIRRYSVHEFDKPGVYLNVLEGQKGSVRYLREIDLMFDMFVDPITRDILIEMGEPTSFQGLLVRSTEMLLTEQHPDELDPAEMRIKGYERLSGAVYGELVKALRVQRAESFGDKKPIEMNPYAVWTVINTDPAVTVVSEINPIRDLKDQEAVTYNGVGGRSSRSMSKNTRIFHENDMGTISESTTDSADVAINVFTSADPQFTSLRGLSRRYKHGETGITALLSTSSLMAPGTTQDDAKRSNFVGIQNDHSVACSGYSQLPVRTGYDSVIPHRVGDLFAFTAKKNGKVVSVTDKMVTVEYEDGETKSVEIGRRFGSAAGITIPHELVVNVKEGQRLKVGDVITYNSGYFEKDLLNPKHVVPKSGMVVKTALMESVDTLEDSSAISLRISEKMKTNITKVKTIVVDFDQSIRKLVKVGDTVESETILCWIEDAVTAEGGLFNDENLDTLKVLSSQTPQAKVKGVIEKIEIYYHGEKEDMSDSLREVANAFDRELAKQARSSGRKVTNGSVDEGFRIEGEPLALDSVAIRVYITSELDAGIGDKGVFANQLKTVIGRVFGAPIISESGVEIDAIFGRKSIDDRIVRSPDIIGTTTTLLEVIADRAVAIYEGK